MREPGCPNSIRISPLKEAPIIPDQAPNKKYIVPISLWLVEYIQRIVTQTHILHTTGYTGPVPGCM